jgi:hypothetical protein
MPSGVIRWETWAVNGGGREPEVRKRRFHLTRDLAMFGLGAGAFVYEVAVGGDRANIIYGALALMGVAAYLRGVAAVNGDKK